MAIYHMYSQVISRGGGRNIIAAIAYRSGSKLHEDRTGLVYDYTRKAGVVHSEIMAPANAPDWMLDRERLWNGVDAAEKRCDSQTGREVRVALPQELTMEQQLDVLHRFIDSTFVSRGMVADFSLHHDNPQNPHAHIVMTTRSIEGDDFGLKCRDWNNKDLFLEWRESWANECNRALNRAGHDMQIDHRSYAEQGIALQPSIHVGKDADRAKGDVDGFVVQERLREQNRIARENGSTIIAFPEIALHALSAQQRIFTRADVGQWLFSRTVDAEQFAKALGGVMNHEDVVRLDFRDEHLNECFSTKQTQESELVYRAQAVQLLQQERQKVPKQDIDQACVHQCLNVEQRRTVHEVVNSPNLTVIAFDKENDKVRVLDAARSAWSGQGHHVTAVTTSGSVARDFEQNTGIPTLAWRDLENAWVQENHKLTHKNVLIVENASLLNTDEMACVLGEAAGANAKVVLIDGVSHSGMDLKTPLRDLENLAGVIRFDDFSKQREEWQREALVLLARGDAENALNAYTARGHVHLCQDRDGALQATACAWDQGRAIAPDSVMLARGDLDVSRLNSLARELASSRGQLGYGEKIETCFGVRDFSEGDRVQFCISDRQMGVKEGSFGTLVRLQNGQMLVALDGNGRQVAFDTRSYDAVAYGYAVALDKAGEIKAEHVYVCSSRDFDSDATRSALTRHSSRVDIFTDRKSLAAMVRHPHHVRDVSGEREKAIPKAARLEQVVPRIESTERRGESKEQGYGDPEGFDLSF